MKQNNTHDFFLIKWLGIKQFIWPVLVIFLSFNTLKSYSQPVFSNISLLHGWKIQKGDNMEWKEPNFDDSDWQEAEVTHYFEDFPGFHAYDGYAWYRISVFIPSSLKEKASGTDSLHIRLGLVDDNDQTFLNGTLIGENARNSYGNGNPEFAGEKETYGLLRDYTLPLSHQAIKWDEVNVIAIRAYDYYLTGGLKIDHPGIFVRPGWKEYVQLNRKNFVLGYTLGEPMKLGFEAINDSKSIDFDTEFIAEIRVLNTETPILYYHEKAILKRESKKEFDLEFIPTTRAEYLVTYSIMNSETKQTISNNVIIPNFSPVTIKKEERLKMDVLGNIEYQVNGEIGKRVKGNIDHWIISMPKDNPGLLDMFEMRETDPPLHLLPWSGEFVGKYLTSGILALHMSDDPELKNTLSQVVDQLIDLQAADGYLGPFPKEQRFIGHCYWDPEGQEGHWDLWGQYQIIYSLLLWNEYTGEEKALEAATKAADLMCETFLESDMEVIDAEFPNQNGAIAHALILLHNKTGKQQYLKLAKNILEHYELGGEYVEKGLQGIDYYEIRAEGHGREGATHWENLHILQAFAEYFLLTGDSKYKKAFLHHWHSINKTDIHNTGAFSTNEKAVGSPYKEGSIETCCTVAWIAMSIDALRLSADPKIADALESSLFNAMAASQHPSGEWWTYDTPMNGRKYPSYVSINFQTRSFTPELNCCSVNGPRSLGSLCRWGIMNADDALVVNYYGPLEASLKLPSGKSIKLVQKTDYPYHGKIDLQIEGANGEELPLWLRIPEWSGNTRILVNDIEKNNITNGSYYKLTRDWNDGDHITIHLDMNIRYIEGAERFDDHVSIYRGPLLLAMDPRFNPEISEPFPIHGWAPPWTEPLPVIDVKNISDIEVISKKSIAYSAGLYQPWLLVKLPINDKRGIILCDFATAGYPGTSYQTWLKVSQ